MFLKEVKMLAEALGIQLDLTKGFKTPEWLQKISDIFTWLEDHASLINNIFSLSAYDSSYGSLLDKIFSLSELTSAYGADFNKIFSKDELETSWASTWNNIFSMSSLNAAMGDFASPVELDDDENPIFDRPTFQFKVNKIINGVEYFTLGEVVWEVIYDTLSALYSYMDSASGLFDHILNSELQVVLPLFSSFGILVAERESTEDPFTLHDFRVSETPPSWLTGTKETIRNSTFFALHIVPQFVFTTKLPNAVITNSLYYKSGETWVPGSDYKLRNLIYDAICFGFVTLICALMVKIGMGHKQDDFVSQFLKGPGTNTAYVFMKNNYAGQSSKLLTTMWTTAIINNVFGIAYNNASLSALGASLGVPSDVITAIQTAINSGETDVPDMSQIESDITDVLADTEEMTSEIDEIISKIDTIDNIADLILERASRRFY